MLKDLVKAGVRAEITPGADADKVYISRVKEILDEKQIVMYAPLLYGRVAILPIDKPFSFLFFPESGMLSFDGLVKGYKKEEGIDLMLALLTSEGQRTQRRNFFRYPCVLPLKFSVLDEDAPPGDESVIRDMREGVVKDLGGGGMRFVSNVQIQEDDRLNCVIMLESGFFLAIVKVINARRLSDAPYRYQYRCSFVGLLKEEQEKIVKFVHNEQLKFIRKR